MISQHTPLASVRPFLPPFCLPALEGCFVERRRCVVVARVLQDAALLHENGRQLLGEDAGVLLVRERLLAQRWDSGSPTTEFSSVRVLQRGREGIPHLRHRVRAWRR